jgi:hypothetical protein
VGRLSSLQLLLQVINKWPRHWQFDTRAQR